MSIDKKVATFAREWFAAFTGDEDHYDIERLDGKSRNTHATLDQFVDELCELIIDAELAARKEGQSTHFNTVKSRS